MTELGQLRDHYREILDRGVEVVAVSVDPPEVSERLRRRLGLPFRFLSDPEGTLMDALSLRHAGGRPPALLARPPDPAHPPGPDIFLPATFLVDGSGTIRWVYRPQTYRVRATPGALAAAIDAARAEAGGAAPSS